MARQRFVYLITLRAAQDPAARQLVKDWFPRRYCEAEGARLEEAIGAASAAHPGQKATGGTLLRVADPAAPVDPAALFD